MQTQGLKVCEKGKSRPIDTRLLPTPRATDAGGRGAVTDAKATSTAYFRENAKGMKFGVQLTDLVASGLLLTPSASDGIRTGFTMDHLMRHRNKKNAATSNLSEQIAHMIGGGTSRLNPLFVAEMMSFPKDWTVSPFLHGAETL